MLGRPIGLVAYCALGASAFLLPPSVASNDDAPPFFPNVVLDLKNQIYQLPCSSCAFPTKDTVTELDEVDSSVEDGMFWAQGGANNLVLNFTVSEDGQGLLVNEHYIYPFDKLVQNKNMMEDMYIDQVPATTSTEQVYEKDYNSATLQVTGSGLTEKETIQGETDADDTIITLQWQLLSLEHERMTVDPVVIQLIRTAEGELLILSIQAEPASMNDGFAAPDFFNSPPQHSGPDATPKPHGRPCKMPGPLCAISDFMDSALGSLHRKPCPGKFGGDHLPTHIRPHFGHSPFGSVDLDSEDDEPEHQHFGPPHLNKIDWRKPWLRLPDSKPFDHPPHPPHPGHRHGPSHHRHNFFHAVSRAILAVIIPIMAGITVGIVVSVTGLLFGRFLGWLWFTVLRRGRRGYTSVALEEAQIGEYKADMTTEEEEALPLYEDAPPYESREQTTS